VVEVVAQGHRAGRLFGQRDWIALLPVHGLAARLPSRSLGEQRDLISRREVLERLLLRLEGCPFESTERGDEPAARFG
jgi:hypothetical protein